jgi:Protein of unknown function (DUF1569)
LPTTFQPGQLVDVFISGVDWRAMKSLYETATVDEVKQRLNALGTSSERKWGKMNAAQMLAHCVAAMETATGDVVIPRLMIGRILGPLVRKNFWNDKPLSKNGPTAPQFVVPDERDLAHERARLIALIEKFAQQGPEKCTRAPHCFFGNLTAEEWGKGMYKHLDHHLQQFGV